MHSCVGMHRCVCVSACVHVCVPALCLSNYFRIPSKTNVCCSPSVEDEGRQTLRESISDGIHAHTRVRTVHTKREFSLLRDATPACSRRNEQWNQKRHSDFTPSVELTATDNKTLSIAMICIV